MSVLETISSRWRRGKKKKCYQTSFKTVYWESYLVWSPFSSPLSRNMSFSADDNIAWMLSSSCWVLSLFTVFNLKRLYKPYLIYIGHNNMPQPITTSVIAFTRSKWERAKHLFVSSLWLLPLPLPFLSFHLFTSDLIYLHLLSALLSCCHFRFRCSCEFDPSSDNMTQWPSVSFCHLTSNGKTNNGFKKSRDLIVSLFRQCFS